MTSPHSGSDLYLQTSQSIAKTITARYSTSFSLASQMLPTHTRQDIYNLYALFRIADEVVDTYSGANQRQLIDDLEQQTYQAIDDSYSPNPVLHAFQHTANTHHIDRSLIASFFAAMRQDTIQYSYSDTERQEYIYGSAEVVGLMCLKVFCRNDQALYLATQQEAQRLGSAFQIVNFLRDYQHDQQQLNRNYLSDGQPLTQARKEQLIQQCRQEFTQALQAIKLLPSDIQPAILTAWQYYQQLLETIDQSSVAQLSQVRATVPNHRKAYLWAKVWTTSNLRRLLS